VKRGKDANFILVWDDGERPNLGVGVSRTENNHAPLWDVDVQLKNARAMKTTVKAATAKEAHKFSENRYPNAVSITVHGKHKGL